MGIVKRLEHTDKDSMNESIGYNIIVTSLHGSKTKSYEGTLYKVEDGELILKSRSGDDIKIQKSTIVGVYRNNRKFEDNGALRLAFRGVVLCLPIIVVLAKYF